MIAPGLIAASARRRAEGAGSSLPRVSAPFWRIYMPLDDGYGTLIVAELEMRSAEGGADACTGGTPAASHGTASAGNAFDGSTSSYWNAGTGNGANASLRYGFPAAVEVVEIAVTARTGVQHGAPRHVVLQHSADGTSWTTLASWLSLDWTGGGTKVLNGANAAPPLPAGTGLMWRVNVSANNGNASATEIAEIEFRAAAGGPDQCTGGAAFASSNVSSPGLAFNDIGASGASPLITNPVTGWIAYAFRDPVAVAEVALTADTTLSRAPRDFSIDHSADGLGWTTARSVADVTGWAADETRTFGV